MFPSSMKWGEQIEERRSIYNWQIVKNILDSMEMKNIKIIHSSQWKYKGENQKRSEVSFLLEERSQYPWLTRQGKGFAGLIKIIFGVAMEVHFQITHTYLLSCLSISTSTTASKSIFLASSSTKR